MAAGDIALVNLQGKGFPAAMVLEAVAVGEGVLPFSIMGVAGWGFLLRRRRRRR